MIVEGVKKVCSKTKTFQFRLKRNEVAAIIDYEPTPTNAKAPNLKDRWYYRPDISLKKFKRTAVIDYLHLDFLLDHNTQAQHVQSAVEEFGYNKPGHAGYNHIEIKHAQTQTVIKKQTAITLIFHDPDFGELNQIVSKLNEKYGVVGTPQVSEIEISVDFLSKEDNEIHRAEMVALLMRHIVPSERIRNVKGGRPSFYGAWQEWFRGFGVRAGLRSWAVRTGKNRHAMANTPLMPQREFAPTPSMKKNQPLIHDRGKVEGKRYGIGLNQPENHPGFEDTYYIGRKTGDEQIKIMHKVKNHQQYYDSGERTLEPKDAEILETKDRRARIEVTLRGEAIKQIGEDGERSLEKLKAFSFQTLQGKYFQFWHPTFKQPDSVPNFTEYCGRSPEELNALEQDLFLRAGALPVHEAQLVQKYWLDVGLPQKNGVGRPREETFEEWSDKSAGHLKAYTELNKAVSAALGNLSAKLNRET